MATFYKLNDSGEYTEADNEVEDLFRSRSDEIIRKKLEKARERETGKIRQYEYENFIMLYEAYKALKGNSFIDKINKEVQEMEVTK